jgi:ribonuclease HI
MKWIMTTILVQVEDAFAQLIPPQQKAYVRGRRMEDHLTSVAATWGQKMPMGMADAWLAIDYSKAYDSVNHGLMEALLCYIGMPSFMISVCLQVMCGDVFFLVGNLPVMEVPLKPLSGIRQGDPFSPLIFVLLASLVLFVAPLPDCDFWLYSDDAFVRVVANSSDLKGRLGELLNKIKEFGYWSGLKLNLDKSEILLRGIPHEPIIHDIKVVPYVRYLGGFIGDISAEKSFAPALSKVWTRLCWLRTAPLSMEEKKDLVHSWIYPCLRIPGLLRRPPPSVIKRLEVGLRIALNMKPWTMTLSMLSLPIHKGGIGLISPKVYLEWLMARHFYRWVNSGLGLNASQTKEFKSWAKSRGVIFEQSHLHLLVLAGKPTAQAPWMAHCVKAWSALMACFKGLMVKHSDIPKLPLWNNRLFMMSGCTKAPTSIVKSFGVLEDVADFPGDYDSSDGILPPTWVCARGLSANAFAMYDDLCRKIMLAWQRGKLVRREGVEFGGDNAMRSPWTLSQNIAEASNIEERQPDGVWRKLAKLRIPGKDKDFIRMALWKKLPTGLRLQRIFPRLSRACPLCGVVEDNEHRLKACPFLSLPLLVMRRCFGVVHHTDIVIEPSRLCIDFPLVSLSTIQGLLLWKTISVLWLFRCRVLFDKQPPHQLAFLELLDTYLGWWQQRPDIAVPTAAVYAYRQSLRHAAEQRGAMVMQWADATLAFADWSRSRRAKRRQHNRDTGNVVLDVSSASLVSDGCTVFTDGSFAFEAPGIGFAGCGVFIPDEPNLSISTFLPGDIQTNNRAELHALILGIKAVPSHSPLLLYSDSKFVVNGATQWLKQWKGAHFRGASGKAVAHADLWQHLDTLLQGREGPWAIRWTAGHVGLHGNEQADRLANEGRLAHPGRQAFLASRASSQCATMCIV